MHINSRGDSSVKANVQPGARRRLGGWTAERVPAGIPGELGRRRQPGRDRLRPARRGGHPLVVVLGIHRNRGPQLSQIGATADAVRLKSRAPEMHESDTEDDDANAEQGARYYLQHRRDAPREWSDPGAEAYPEE